MSEFVEFPKIARLSREIVVTEKIDGTNAQIYILHRDVLTPQTEPYVISWTDNHVLLAGSRNRYLTPGADNFGFAKWAHTYAPYLWALGEGRHFGEWWGSGIQRGYGLTEKRFSLFNVARWGAHRDRVKFPIDHPECCSVVPVLYRGPFTMQAINHELFNLTLTGSRAAPTFMKPEGVVIFHTASGQLFKKTVERDEEPKGRI